MMTTMLIHVAIWTHFAVAHPANTHFDVSAAIKDAVSSQAYFQDRGLYGNTSESPEERVASRATMLSEMPVGDGMTTVAELDEGIAPEKVIKIISLHTGSLLRAHLVHPLYDGRKLGLDAEPAALVDTQFDTEFVALQAEARRFTSSIDFRANSKGPNRETPTVHQDQGYKIDWTERFAFRVEDNGDFYFGGKHVQHRVEVEEDNSGTTVIFGSARLGRSPSPLEPPYANHLSDGFRF